MPDREVLQQTVDGVSTLPLARSGAGNVKMSGESTPFLRAAAAAGVLLGLALVVKLTSRRLGVPLFVVRRWPLAALLQKCQVSEVLRRRYFIARLLSLEPRATCRVHAEATTQAYQERGTNGAQRHAGGDTAAS